MKPNYVKCIKAWTGNGSISIVNKLYKTDGRPHFSSHTWETIYREKPSDPHKYFTEVSEAEWCKQEGLPLPIINNYELY